MTGRWMAAAAALALLGACSSFEPAGRNARESAAPPPPVVTAAPAPQQSAPLPVAASEPEPGVAAPDVSVAPPAPAPQRQSQTGGDIVVPGQVERQVQAPDGDPRSNAERMADIRAWDRCVMRIQGAGGDDPTRPQLDTPEEVCRGELGMASRTAVPNSRR